MKYRNFDLEASDYQEDGGTRSFNVQVQSTPRYEERRQVVPVVLPANLDDRLRTLERRLLNRKEIIELGRDLADALFPTAVRQLLETNLNLVEEVGDRLRIRLKLDDFALADIPWEYVYLPRPDVPEEQWGPEGFLALDARISLVRYERVSGLLGRLTPPGPGPLRIAVLLADPNKPPDYPPLKLDEEKKKLERELAKVEQIHPVFFPDATIDELEDACDSHILHFAGHGVFRTEMGMAFRTEQGKGFLVLLDEDKNPYPLPVDKLMVALRGKQVRLAVLGACETGRRDQVNVWSGIAPALARVGVPATVGMQYKIRDRNATFFSWKFYRTLAEKKPIDEAVNDGRKAVFQRCNDDDRDWGVPVLYLHTEADGGGMLFPDPDVPHVSPDQPATWPTGDMAVSSTGMLAGTPVLGGAAGPLSPVLCPNPECPTYVSASDQYCPDCLTQVRCLRCNWPLRASASGCTKCGLRVAR